MQVELTGGCLCGAVRYRYAGLLGGTLGQVTVCHCGQCRRAQGYAAAVAPIRAAGFAVLAGQDRIRRFESSPGKHRAFCGTCGAPLFSQRAGEPVLRLRLGSLDAAPDGLTIQAHIHTAGLPAWAAPGDGAPCHPGLEPGRAAPENMDEN